MSDTLVINEIYLSLQGESTFAGLPCVFVRLTACDLRCSYCDTAYAFTEGKKMSPLETLMKVRGLAAHFRNSPLATGQPAQVQRSRSLAIAAGRIDRRRAAAPEKFPAADEVAVRRRLHRAARNQRRARHLAGGPARASHHGFEMPEQRRSGTQSLGKSPTPESDRRNQIRHRHASRITSGPNGKSPNTSWTPICPLLFSWVHPLAPEQQDKSLKKVPAGQTPISRQRTGGKNHRRRPAGAVSGPAAQDHLAAGTTRSLEIYDLRFTIYDCARSCPIASRSQIVNRKS